jgi:hypothetical protein
MAVNTVILRPMLAVIYAECRKVLFFPVTDYHRGYLTYPKTLDLAGNVSHAKTLQLKTCFLKDHSSLFYPGVRNDENCFKTLMTGLSVV